LSTDRLTGELAIEASDLVKTYPGDVRALDGVSFAVEAGTVFGLLGPNGAGKSTTVKILTTLSRPDSGQARVAGIDVLRQPDRVRQSIGCVAQKSGVDPQATGRENLTLQGQLYGLGGRELKRRVAELLDRFGLAEAADRQARTYSGGMQRKLDVAMGFVHRPRALFLDEPTTGLDPEARADMWEEISRLAGEEGLTILLTTHYLEEADRLARRLAIVDHGTIVVEGTPEELKARFEREVVVKNAKLKVAWSSVLYVMPENRRAALVEPLYAVSYSLEVPSDDGNTAVSRRKTVGFSLSDPNAPSVDLTPPVRAPQLEKTRKEASGKRS